MAREPKPSEPGRSLRSEPGKRKIGGEPLGGTDFPLERTGGGFSVPINQGRGGGRIGRGGEILTAIATKDGLGSSTVTKDVANTRYARRTDEYLDRTKCQILSRDGLLSIRGSDQRSTSVIMDHEDGRHGAVGLRDNPEAIFALPIGGKQPVSPLQGVVIG